MFPATLMINGGTPLLVPFDVTPTTAVEVDPASVDDQIAADVHRIRTLCGVRRTELPPPGTGVLHRDVACNADTPPRRVPSEVQATGP
jgi:hypothetical protein